MSGSTARASRDALVLAVLLLGCTAKSGPSTSGSGTASSPGTSRLPPSASTTSTPKLPAAPAQPADTAGTCSFEVTGAITASESSGTDATSTYWLAGPPELPALEVHCDGEVVHVDFLASGRIRASEKMAFGPQKIELGTPSSKMIAFVRVNGGGPSEGEGTLDITAFDARHVAATFEVGIPVVGANGAPSRLRIVGSFDAPCTLAECRH